MNDKDLIHRLINKAEQPQNVSSVYEYWKDISTFTEPRNILSILGLDRNSLSNAALEIVDFLEKGEGHDGSLDYVDLKWKLSAFLNIQDIFDNTLYKADDMSNSVYLWYFYFESKYILIESFISGLNGLYLSSEMLLRLFLEFNIIQNYHYKKIKNTRNYEVIERYFKDGKLPKLSKMIKECLPTDNFSKPIKSRLNIHWRALSQTSVHPYHPTISPKSYTGFLPEVSAEGIFFWLNQRIVLEAILWIYYVNFPMLFHPVKSLEKFGFNGPVGVFINQTIGQIVKKSMTENDFNLFMDYSKNTEDVKVAMEFYNSKPELSEQQIIESWVGNDEPFKGIEEEYVIMMAKQRVTKELLSFPKFDESKDKNNEIDCSIFNYENWQESYKKYFNVTTK